MNAAIAAHRFGLGEATLDAVRGEPREWLALQIAAADVQRGNALPSAAEGVRRQAEFVRAQRENRMSAVNGSTEQRIVEFPMVRNDIRARLVTAAITTRPFAERLVMFWTNHFTVSTNKATALVLFRMNAAWPGSVCG